MMKICTAQIVGTESLKEGFRMLEAEEGIEFITEINYEAEYYRFKDRYDALSCKCELMYGDYEALKRENEILKAQLDMVRLIFGR